MSVLWLAFLRDYIEEMKRPLTMRARAALSSDGVVRVYTSKAGVRRVCGGPKLKGTQTYTKQFGRCVARAHSRHTLATHLKSSPARALLAQDLCRGVAGDSNMTWSDAKLSAVQRFLARRAAVA